MAPDRGKYIPGFIPWSEDIILSDIDEQPAVNSSGMRVRMAFLITDPEFPLHVLNVFVPMLDVQDPHLIMLFVGDLISFNIVGGIE